MADVEADIRAGLAEGAKIYVTLIRRTLTTADGAVDGLVRKAFGSPDRLRDALDLLGEDGTRRTHGRRSRPGSSRGPTRAGTAGRGRLRPPAGIRSRAGLRTKA